MSPCLSSNFFLRGQFADLNTTPCMLAETCYSPTATKDPLVLLTRYMDNMHQAVRNIPTHMHANLKHFLMQPMGANVD